MEIGGAERSLLGLLNGLDTSLYDVDLFVYNHVGEFMPLIPDTVHLLREEKKYAALERPLKAVLKSGYIDIVLARIGAKLAYAGYCWRNKLPGGSAIFQYIANYTTPLLPSLARYGVYDLAISFLTPHNIVLDKVKAHKKMAWIHTDYSTIQVNKQQEMNCWKRYDYIASISESVTFAFLSVFSELKDKIVLIENILSPDFVRRQAMVEDVSAEMYAPADTVKLCSVGRFSEAKNFDNIPSICKKILEKGCTVKWFIVGGGSDEALIRENIRQTGMEEYVILLGKKANPYPYVALSDIYIQPSRYEGKAVTVCEAQILCKPVVITCFATAASQLRDDFDGVIVPMDNERVAQGIVDLLQDTEKQNRLIRNMQNTVYGNAGEIEKIYKLINE